MFLVARTFGRDVKTIINLVAKITAKAQSPDLNPIEHVWDERNRRIRRLSQPPRTLHQLEVALVNEWNNITQAEIRNYILSMRSRCLAVINANGGHTRY